MNVLPVARNQTELQKGSKILLLLLINVLPLYRSQIQLPKGTKNTLGTLNVRGLRHKVNKVSDLLSQENLDMLFLTETLLSAEVGDGEPRIDGYFFFSKGIGEDKEEVLEFISGKNCQYFLRMFQIHHHLSNWNFYS